MAEETSSMPMDSGAFVDIVPIILNYLDLKSRIQLSKTCRFWWTQIYVTNIRLWSKEVIELPYVGSLGCDHESRHKCTCSAENKLWSTISPPPDPNALENVLSPMASSTESIERFQLVEKVHFKNYIHTDESLRLTALLFPSIKQISFEGSLLTEVGVQYIAKSCSKLKHIEFYECENLNIPKIFQLFNSEEHQNNLERIFLDDRKYHNSFSVKDVLPFMALCQRCGLYFNQLKNDKEMLCLYHPGEYSGYGHSCSSFACCRSNTPRYPSTFGCQYTYHTKYRQSVERVLYEYHALKDGLPEFMFEKYDYEKLKFPFYFLSRRKSWNYMKRWKRLSTTS